MKRTVIINVFFTGVVFLSLTGFVVWSVIENNNPNLPYYGNGKLALTVAERESKELKAVPVFSFTDENGKQIDNAFTNGKVWVADYFFTNCRSICPKMSKGLQQVQQAFETEEDLKMISFTCDPERDSAAQLKMYAGLYDADATQWRFATGEKPELYRFARKGLNIVATDGDGGAEDFIHSQNLVLVDREGYIRGYYDGTDAASVNQLIKDIKKIL